jgi:DNA mismatch endonuclease (patch repair protein)
MPDSLSREERSDRMRRIRKTDTKPELAVRRLAHGMGFRFRLHRRDLPGTPDLVFLRLRKVIFVHGCFWHQHDCRLGSKQPTANPEYWLPKLARNVERDKLARQRLSDEGWDVLVIWECQTKAPDRLESLVRSFLATGVPTVKLLQ